MSVKKFSQKDLDMIRDAVQSAEKRTAGEIVTYFVAQSDEYEEVRLRSVLMFVAAPLFLLAILSYAWLLPIQVTPFLVTIISTVMGVVGYFMPSVWPGYKRLLLSQSRLQNAVERRAMAAFLTEEVFATENRTGILIFISHFEHVVEVIGDSGINSKVDQNEWENVVKLIIEGIKDKNPVGGIIKGIHKCGELLEKSGVNKPPDNPNELSDDIRIS